MGVADQPVTIGGFGDAEALAGQGLADEDRGRDDTLCRPHLSLSPGSVRCGVAPAPVTADLLPK